MDGSTSKQLLQFLGAMVWKNNRHLIIPDDSIAEHVELIYYHVGTEWHIMLPGEAPDQLRTVSTRDSSTPSQQSPDRTNAEI